MLIWALGGWVAVIIFVFFAEVFAEVSGMGV